jgi:hypothetical protein
LHKRGANVLALKPNSLCFWAGQTGFSIGALRIDWEVIVRVIQTVVLLVVFLVIPSRAAAQQLLQLDPTPLARPAALTTYTFGDAVKVFKAISKALTDFGFNLTRSDTSHGELEATQIDAQSGGQSDHILVWIERDFANPNQQFNVYFLYGRYATVQGHAEPVRIRSSSDLEEQRVGKLKSSLVSQSF